MSFKRQKWPIRPNKRLHLKWGEREQIVYVYEWITKPKPTPSFKDNKTMGILFTKHCKLTMNEWDLRGMEVLQVTRVYKNHLDPRNPWLVIEHKKRHQ